MEYGLRWTIPFKTLDDVSRVVNIYDADYSGDATTLEGGEIPLETQETTDEDILLPVRTQTGYINVIDNGDLDGLMPLDNKQHYVELVEGSTVLWQGFMKAAVYSSSWDVAPVEAKFPVMSYVEVLDGIDIDKSSGMGLVTIGELIHEAATILDGHDWEVVNYIYFPAEFGSSASDWWKVLQMKVSKSNFFDENNSVNTEDVDYTKYSTDSYKSMLEKICTLFGWTLKEEPGQWTFVSTKTNQYFRLGITTMATIASLETLEVTVEELSTVAISDMELDGTGHSSDMLQGCRTFEVSAKTNAVSDVEGIEIDLDGKSYVREGSVAAATDNYVRCLIYDSGQPTHPDEETPLVLYAWSGDAVTQGGDVEWGQRTYDSGVDAVSGVDGYVIAHLMKYDHYTQTELDENTKISYSYTPGILIRHQVPYDQGGDATDATVPVVTLNGSLMPALLDGCFDLDMEFKCPGLGLVNNTSVLCELQVGDHYWNGTTWTTTRSQFGVELKDGKAKVTKTLNMPYEGASHHVIPIDQMISGQVRLTIYNEITLTNLATGDVILQGISLMYCPIETETVKTTDVNNYYGVDDNGFKERKKVTLEMATYRNNGAGHGIMMYNGARVDGTTFPQGRFEDYLLSNLKRLFARYTEKLTLQVRATTLTPRTRVTRDGTTYQVISVAQNWADDGQTIIVEALP